MLILKRYDRAAFRRRYHRYRLFFGLAYAVFLLSFLLSAIFFRRAGATFSGENYAIRETFLRLFSTELILATVLFLTGVTLYAPAVLFLGGIARGVMSGYVLAGFELVSAKNVFTAAFCALYFLLGAALFLAYASFCAAVSVRIFSEGTLADPRREEERMFGGTLFFSSLFCRTINMRFLFSYTLVFLCAGIFWCLLTLSYSAGLSLFF